MNQFLDFALQYAKLGWKVFPCHPGQKIPCTMHGVKDASSDEGQIRDWWNKNPNANVAVACGGGSGVYVIDLDVSASGANGWNTLTKLATEGKILPKTVKSNTPRGGAHFFYKSSNPPKNDSKSYSGFEIKSDGYYVVLPPSVHPNGRIYEWARGLSPFEFGFAEFPDFLRIEKEVRKVMEQEVPQLKVSEKASDDIIKRASAYLATCDSAIQGNRGHDKLLWAASCLIHGFMLSDSQAFDLLATEYNPKCEPPWDLSDPKDRKDFLRKITEARRLSPDKQQGWLINEDSSSYLATLDLESLLKTVKTEPGVSRTKDIEENDPRLEYLTNPPGLVGETCKWINSTSLKLQPLLTLGCVLAFYGALFGRKVKDQLGTRTNIYCMGIAPTSSGKNHAVEQIRLLAIDSNCHELLGGEDFASDTSIEARLEKGPSTLFLCDEIGHLLQATKSGKNAYTVKVISLLMKLYSASKSIYCGREYAEIEKRRILIQPCCCIYGTSTPQRFIDAISPDEITDGWLSRCLVFYTENNPEKTYSSTGKVPEKISSEVRRWFYRQIERDKNNGNINAYVNYYTGGVVSAPPEQLVVDTDNEAEEAYRTFDRELSKMSIGNQLMAPLYGKAEENARKIGLIVACGVNFEKPVITKNIAEYSCELINYILSSFRIEAIFENPIEKKKTKILNIIKSFGVNGCLKRELTRKTQWLSMTERKMLIEDLMDAELIVRKVSGHKCIYWFIDDYLQRTIKDAT